MTIKRSIVYVTLPLFLLAAHNHAWSAESLGPPVSIKLLELQEEVLQLTSKLNALSNDRNPDVSKPLKDLTNRIGAIESSMPSPDVLPSLRTQLAEAQDRLNRLERQIATAGQSDDISTLSDRLSDRINTFEDSSRRSDEELRARIGEVQSLAPTHDQLATIKRQLTVTDDKFNGISTRLSSMETSSEALANRLKGLQTIEEQLSDAKTTIHTLGQRTTAAQEAHEQLVVRVEEKMAQMRGLEDRIEAATAEMMLRIEQVDAASAALKQQIEATTAAANAGDNELRTRLDRREIETQQAVKRLSRDLNRVELAFGRASAPQQSPAPAKPPAATEHDVATLRGEVRELDQANAARLRSYQSALQTLEDRVEQLAQAPIVRPVDIREIEQIVEGLRVEVGVLKANSPLSTR